MSLTASVVSETLQDPKFFSEMEIQHREQLVSMDFANTRFQANLSKGSILKLTDEIQVEATDTNMTDSLTYPDLDSSEQTFTVDNASKVLFAVNDSDDVQSVFDNAEKAKSNGIFRIGRRTDEFNFLSLKNRGNLELPAIDLTALSTNSAKGNAVYAAIQDANELIDAGGFNRSNRRAGLSPEIKRFLMDADKLQLSTNDAETRNQNGRVGMIDSTGLNESINLSGDTQDFVVKAKGAITVGEKKFTIDNDGTGTIFPPTIGDTFTNNGVIFKILTVKEVSTNVEYVITVDKPIQSQIADNASITLTGKETINVPLVEGLPGDGVTQKNPVFTAIPDPDRFRTLFRAFIIHDMFVTLEKSRQLVHIPFRIRTLT